MSRAAILVFAMLLGGCVHRPHHPSIAIALDEVLAFADPARCEPGPPYARLRAAMVEGDANAGFRPGKVVVPARYAAAFGPVQLREYEGYTIIGTAVRGTLFGLPIVTIEESLPEGGDPGETHLRFKAPPDAVQRALAERGFKAEMDRSVAIGPPDGYEHFIELTSDPVYPGHTLLSCGYR